MESALYGIYALVVFVSEILLVLTTLDLEATCKLVNQARWTLWVYSFTWITQISFGSTSILPISVVITKEPFCGTEIHQNSSKL